MQTTEKRRLNEMCRNKFSGYKNQRISATLRSIAYNNNEKTTEKMSFRNFAVFAGGHMV